MLVGGFAELGIPHEVLDLSPRDASRIDGSFAVGRALSYLRPLWRASRRLLFGPRHNVYLLIAQSWMGFLRDAAFITLAALRGHRLVLHLKGGNYDAFYAGQSGWRRALIRRALSRADAILVLSAVFREQFAFVDDPERVIHVVPNGLPMAEDRLPSGAKKLPTSAGEPIRILFLSNLIDSKGYLELLEAVRILSEQHIPVVARFCGAFMLASETLRYASVDEAREDFATRVSRAGLEGRVVWSGPVSGDEKWRALEEAHFFVLPTRYSNEGQPVSIIEALASGCCVVATRYRSIPEMLDEGRAGILLDGTTPEEIAVSISTVIEDPARFAEISRSAVGHFRACYRRSAHLQRIIPWITGGPVREVPDSESPGDRQLPFISQS